MRTRQAQHNDLQFDYFSAAYLDFEADFYKYSALNTPLTFLTGDILLMMAESQKNYFKLNKENARDFRDHYFVFRIMPSQENPLIRHYVYQGHQLFPYQGRSGVEEE